MLLYFDYSEDNQGVPVAEHDAGVHEIVDSGGVVQDPGNSALLRHEDHGLLRLVPVDVPDHPLPEAPGEVAEHQVEAGGQVNRDTGVDIADLRGEEVQGHQDQHQGHMAQRGGDLPELVAPHDVVHAVKNDDDQQVHHRQDDRQGKIIPPLVGPDAPAVTDHIAQHKGYLQDQEVPQDEVQVLQPALRASFVHAIPAFSDVFDGAVWVSSSARF